MDKTLLVYSILCGITLASLVFFAADADESRARKLAKIRVRIDHHQRGRLQEPREDDFEYPWAVKWLSAGIAFLLFLFLVSQM